MSEWQPIKTVPDGSGMILVCAVVRERNTHCVLGHWVDVIDWQHYMELRDSGEWEHLDPTHWMPLPKPPAE